MHDRHARRAGFLPWVAGFVSLVVLTALAGWVGARLLSKRLARHSQAQEQATRDTLSTNWLSAPPLSVDAIKPIRMGMNLTGISDWSTQWPFVDIMKHSRGWFAQSASGDGPWETGEVIETTPQGWPLLKEGQAAGTLMLRENSPYYPAGTYTCTYQGSGQIEFAFAAKVISEKPGRIDLDVKHNPGGIYMKIIRSDRNDPIRDIRILMPGFEQATSPFHPLFVERLQPFGVLRFMDWQQTNSDQPARWHRRTLPASARQSSEAGVAIEHMIDLANTLHADPWFCMPHRADDEYVREFARMTLTSLHADATVYIEYSNEAWNNMFPVYDFLEVRRKEKGITHHQAYADEAARIFRIWKDVFADSPHRVIRVAAAQHYNPRVATEILDRLKGDCDALAIAMYASPNHEDITTYDATTTPEAILAASAGELFARGVPTAIEHAELARRWSSRTGRTIPLIAYEGGQHLTVWGKKDSPFEPGFRAAQHHEAMGRLYDSLLSEWNALGGGLFVAFSNVGGWGRHGYWGHLEYQDEPLDRAVRYRALLRHAAPRTPHTLQQP